jgi:hypothetical protein
VDCAVVDFLCVPQFRDEQRDLHSEVFGADTKVELAAVDVQAGKY